MLPAFRSFLAGLLTSALAGVAGPVAAGAAGVLAVARASAAAQSLASRPLELPAEGVRLRPPREWRSVPVEPRLGALGVVARLGGPPLATRLENTVVDFEPELFVLCEDRPRGDPSVRSSEGRRGSGRTRAASDVALVVPEMLRGLRVFDEEEPVLDERKELRGTRTRQRRFEAEERRAEGRIPVTVEIWEVSGEPEGVALVFYLPTQHAERYATTFRRCARSLEPIERVELPALGPDATYEAILEYHRLLARRAEGWRALPTPSREYVVTTSSSNERFVDEAIDRLERARAVFEQDVPLAPDLAAEPGGTPRAPQVAIVRICSDVEEFQTYGDTPEGVVGWFSPVTGELVLYDSVATDRNKTFAVMIHEAFHQYCRLALGGEAHPWYEEGHGDYYAGLRFAPRQTTVQARLPGELDRRDEVRRIVREERTAPLESHLRARGSAWREGADGAAAAYAQSWSLVYYLRRGMAGDLPRKVWREAYAGILPRYERALRSGWGRLATAAGSQGPRTGGALVEALAVGADERRAVLDAAFEAAWGPVDLVAFEADWKLWIDRYLGE